MDYIRKVGDKAYRKINLFSNTLPGFTDFTGDQQRITVNADQVLEIRSESGDQIVTPNANLEDVYYGTFGKDQIWVSCTAGSEICARIWLKAGSDMLYKLPRKLVMRDNKVWATVPDAAAGIELKGDAYFESAFRLIRK